MRKNAKKAEAAPQAVVEEGEPKTPISLHTSDGDQDTAGAGPSQQVTQATDDAGGATALPGTNTGTASSTLPSSAAAPHPKAPKLPSSGIVLSEKVLKSILEHISTTSTASMEKQMTELKSAMTKFGNPITTAVENFDEIHPCGIHHSCSPAESGSDG